MLKKITVYAFTLMLAAGSAFAGLNDKPPEIAGSIHADTPYGTGTLNKAIFHVYDSSLWTDAATWSADKPYALANTYNMKFTAQELAARTVDEMKRFRDITPAEGGKLENLFTSVFHDVKKGDRITALYLPKSGVTLFYNGTKTGRIADDKTARAFLAIWLDEKTSEPKLRAQLLNKGHSK